MEKLEVVGRYDNIQTANIAKGFLESNGVIATVFSDDCGGMRPHFQITQGVRLMVKEENLEMASQLLKEIDGNKNG